MLTHELQKIQPILIHLCYIPDIRNDIWHVSDDGSDDNDCHSAFAPCRNLQTVLDRATDGADIYVTSETLLICSVNSIISFNISGINVSIINVTCPGMYIYTW